MRGARHVAGSSVIEVLVALTCTGMLAAAVLSLMVDGVATVRARLAQVDAESRSRDALLAVDLVLREAGAGLEGARSIALEGELLAVVELAPDSLRTVIPLEPAREVEPQTGGRLRLASVAGWEPRDLVVGLGVRGDPADPAPAGRIVDVQRDRPRGPSGGSVRVAWAPAEAAVLAAEGEPRALVRVAVREFARRSGELGIELRRRDLGGRWQPVTDALERVAFRSLDPPGVAWPPAGALVEVEARAPVRGAPDAVLRHRLRLR